MGRTTVAGNGFKEEMLMYIKEIDIDKIEGRTAARCKSALVVDEFVDSGFKACEVECDGEESKKVASRLRNYIIYHELADEIIVIRRGDKVYLAYK